jgi:peroxiredoxin
VEVEEKAMARLSRNLILLVALAGGCLPAFLIPGVFPGRTAPPIEGTDAYERPLRLEDYRGKVILLHFGLIHCSPCRELLAEEKLLQDRHAGRPLVVLGVSGDESREALRAFQQKHAITAPTWFDGPEGPIASVWGVSRFPTLFLIDHKGEVRQRHVGLPPAGWLETQLGSLLAEAEKR